MFKKLLDGIERTQAALLAVVYVLTIVVVSFQVINRFILHWPVVWTADFAVICFIWLGFLCGSQAVRHGAHFRMTILLERKWKGPGREVLEWFSVIIVVAMSLVLLIGGSIVTVEGLKETSPGLKVSMAWSYAAIPVSSFTALLFAIEKMVQRLRPRQLPLTAELTEQL